MTEEEKKSYIKQHWRIASGRKIELMLKRYWGLETLNRVEGLDKTGGEKEKVKEFRQDLRDGYWAGISPKPSEDLYEQAKGIFK